MIEDCPACGHEMQVQLQGLRIPQILCPDCGERFTRFTDWLTLTPLSPILTEWYQAKRRVELVKLRAELYYLKARLKWVKAKIGFWETVAGQMGPPTPEQSEALTGVEVRDDDE
jgi:hypothetical protein